MAFETAGSDRNIADGNLPRTDELIADAKSAHRTVSDMNEKGIVSNGRKTQYALNGFFQFDARQVDIFRPVFHAINIARHLGRFAKQHFHRHVDNLIVEFRIRDDQMFHLGQCPDCRVRTIFTVADSGKLLCAIGRNDKDISFLRLIAPDTHR